MALPLIMFILSAAFLPLISAATPGPRAGLSDDRAALLSFASSLSLADGGNDIPGWDSPNVCNWTGVVCRPGILRVSQLVLSGIGLSGPIPSAVGNLSFLRVLDLSKNSLSGVVAAEIGSLSRLRQLSLSGNRLTGRIPPRLGLLQKLQYLDLGSNRLAGGIPGTLFCNCTALQYVDLTNNSLAGPIPFSGDCRPASLRFLLLWSNQLSGPIPPAMSNASMLEWVDVESNYLAGDLPGDIFGKLTRLQLLMLSYNNLSSAAAAGDALIPFFASLSNCTALRELELAGNGIAGEIPASIGRLPATLRSLHLEDNALGGTIPANITVLVNLTYLNLSNNLLNGAIPPDLSRLQRLERLFLRGNLLSGEIPHSFGELLHLGLVDLSGNRLSGEIPDTLSNLTQLRRLVLHHNEFSGGIPASLAGCENLEALDLSFNRLNGGIPVQLAELTGLKIYMNLSNNELAGAIPPGFGKMDMLLALDLSSNRLTGPIPPQLGGCVALQNLNLSSNGLRGPIPASLGSLPFLQVLDLSRNMLAGEVPTSLQASSSLRQLNLSFNPQLCGPMTGVDEPCGGGHAPKKRAVVLPVVLAVAGAGALLCVVVGVWIVRRRIGRESSGRLLDEEARSSRGHIPRVSYRELAEATRGFAQASLIGAGRFGRVYSGTLRDGRRVAVKVLDPQGGEVISGSFDRECQVLKRARHKNLVRVITTCSRPDFKALVLPLMPNGSLESFLYPRDAALDAGLALRILGDVAEGVAYLHHHAPFKAVHCDLKPSNVLLDAGLRAVVADFGIARLLKGPEDHHGDDSSGAIATSSASSSTGLLQGSVGYIAPEYGIGGNPSTQGDVYSFGVMVLEMVAGKRPTDVIFHQGQTLHDWVRTLYPHNLDAIVVPELSRTPSEMHVLAELIELGLACSAHSPSSRPTMVDVTHSLTLLREELAKYVDTK